MIRFYHTSDMHDRRGFEPRLRALRAERPGLLFDSGDSLRGSQTVYHRNEPIVAEIDAAGYAAQAIGNREFHYLYGLLRARAAHMQHPLVSTNLRDTKGRPLPFVPALTFASDAAGQTGGRAFTIHVLGLLIMQYPVGSAWERVFGWRFLDPWDAVAPYAAQLPDGDALVVLSHVGLTLDRELASRVPRIDLILGGHSHDTAFEPMFESAVPIVHAGPYARYVSRTEMSYNDAEQRFAIDDFALLPLLGAQ
jgi:2',3'-cyclic-nucleotide 2'-phosphodiesterase (5'-nucleotidase family)